MREFVGTKLCVFVTCTLLKDPSSRRLTFVLRRLPGKDLWRNGRNDRD